MNEQTPRDGAPEQRFKRGIVEKALTWAAKREWIPIIEPTAQERSKFILRESHIADYMQPGQKWADIGTGPGHTLEQIIKTTQDNQITIIGLDPFVVPFRPVRNRLASNKHHSFIRGAGQQIPLADHSVDGATLFFTLHHIPPNDRNLVLNEVQRIVKPEGIVCIVEDTPKDSKQAKVVELWDRMANGGVKGGEEHLGDQQWEDIFSKRGYILDHKYNFYSRDPFGRDVPHTSFIFKLPNNDTPR